METHKTISYEYSYDVGRVESIQNSPELSYCDLAFHVINKQWKRNYFGHTYSIRVYIYYHKIACHSTPCTLLRTNEIFQNWHRKRVAINKLNKIKIKAKCTKCTKCFINNNILVYFTHMSIVLAKLPSFWWSPFTSPMDKCQSFYQGFLKSKRVKQTRGKNPIFD